MLIIKTNYIKIHEKPGEVPSININNRYMLCVNFDFTQLNVLFSHCHLVTALNSVLYIETPHYILKREKCSVMFYDPRLQI